MNQGIEDTLNWVKNHIDAALATQGEDAIEEIEEAIKELVMAKRMILENKG